MVNSIENVCVFHRFFLVNSIENVHFMFFIYIWDNIGENGEAFVFWTKNYENGDVFNSSLLKMMELVKNDK